MYALVAAQYNVYYLSEWLDYSCINCEKIVKEGRTVARQIKSKLKLSALLIAG